MQWKMNTSELLLSFQTYSSTQSTICRPEREVDHSPERRQAQLLQNQLSPHELAYQESLIQEREQDIREIETGIHELAEIFRDLGTIVHQQGGMLGTSIQATFVIMVPYLKLLPDNIESNISSVAVDTSQAASELTSAAEYQRKAGRRAACLMLVLIIVVAIVLLAVCPSLCSACFPSLTMVGRFYLESDVVTFPFTVFIIPLLCLRLGPSLYSRFHDITIHYTYTGLLVNFFV